MKGMIILVVAIIVLVILLILVVMISGLAIKKLLRLIQDFAADDTTLLRQWLDENIEEEILCNIIWTFENNSKFEGVVYDFSNFQENGLVGVTTCCKERYFFEKEFFDENGEPIVSIIPEQTILLLKDGGYEWDMRPYL